MVRSPRTLSGTTRRPFWKLTNPMDKSPPVKLTFGVLPLEDCAMVSCPTVSSWAMLNSCSLDPSNVRSVDWRSPLLKTKLAADCTLAATVAPLTSTSPLASSVPGSLISPSVPSLSVVIRATDKVSGSFALSCKSTLLLLDTSIVNAPTSRFAPGSTSTPTGGSNHQGVNSATGRNSVSSALTATSVIFQRVGTQRTDHITNGASAVRRTVEPSAIVTARGSFASSDTAPSSTSSVPLMVTSPLTALASPKSAVAPLRCPH